MTGPGSCDARALHLDREDLVAAVRDDDRRDVEALARLRPQRLQRVHRAAVRLQREHRPVRTGDGRAGRRRWPMPDRAAGEREQGVARRARRGRPVRAARADALVDDDRALRLRGGERRAERRRRERAGLRGGRRRRGLRQRAVGDAEVLRQALERIDAVLAGRAERHDRQVRRRDLAREVRVGEERDRLGRAGEDERRCVAQRVRRGLGEVLEALDRGQPSAALHPRGERLAHEATAGRGRDAPGRRHAGLRAERVAAEEQHAAGQRGRRALDRVVVDVRPARRAPARRRARPRRPTRSPRAR